MENFEGSFLKDKYWAKKEFRDAAEEAVEKKKRLGEEGDWQIPQEPGEKIPVYLERLERVTARTDPGTGERGRWLLEKTLYPRLCHQAGQHLGRVQQRHSAGQLCRTARL